MVDFVDEGDHYNPETSSIVMTGAANPEQYEADMFEAGELDFKDQSIKKPNL